MKTSNYRFYIYRYQILPIDRHNQGLLFSSIEELLEKKNEKLQTILTSFDKISDSDSDIIIKSLYRDDDSFLYKFAVNRSIVLETQSFTKDKLPNWPSFLVYFWNDSDKQYLIIEDRKKAYQKSDTIVNSIEKYLSSKLKSELLTIRFESLFDEEDFWHIIEKYKGRLREINFELITPNMANISGVLSDDLKEFAFSTNTTKTQVSIVSDVESSLAISNRNEMIGSLVKYSSEGGGKITMKVKDLHSKIQTSKTKKHFEIGEIEISGLTPEVIVQLIKGFLQ